MSKMFLFFSHKLTDEQIKDAKENLKIKEFVYLPKDLQEKFSNVPPEIDDIKKYSEIFIDFIKNNMKKEDFALIQGDFGVVYHLVDFCKKNNLKAIYSTTKRISKEKEVNGKIVKVSEFKHIKFRFY